MIYPLLMLLMPLPLSGQDNGEAFIEQVAERHGRTLLEVQRGFTKPIPIFGNMDVVPSGDASGGESDAEIIQHGYNNHAVVEQYGNNHQVGISQIGSENIGEILQIGQNNEGSIYQEGSGNNASMRFNGSWNIISVHQLGNDNLFNLDLTGDDNSLNLFQHGNDNVYDRTVTGDAVLNEEVSQLGNGNKATQIGVMSNGRSAGILQEGNGLEVIIRHEP